MAATEHIEIIGNETRTAGQARGLIDRIREANDDLSQLVRVLQQVGGDTAALSALLGIPADNASAVRDILASLKAELAADPSLAQMLSRLG